MSTLRILWCFLLCYLYIWNKLLLLDWVHYIVITLFTCIYSIRHNSRLCKNYPEQKELGSGGGRGETQESSCDLLCAGTLSYSSPYLQAAGRDFGHTVLIKCLLNWFDINLKEKGSHHLGMKFWKGEVPLIKTMYYLSQMNYGAHKHSRDSACDTMES